MECQSIRGLTTSLPWNFCGWTCFILESYLIYKICICRIIDPDGVCKYFLKVVWIFLFSWLPVYIEKDQQLAVMSMGLMMPLHGEDQRKMVFNLLCSFTYLNLFNLVSHCRSECFILSETSLKSLQGIMLPHIESLFCNAQTYLEFKT